MVRANLRSLVKILFFIAACKTPKTRRSFVVQPQLQSCSSAPPQTAKPMQTESMSKTVLAKSLGFLVFQYPRQVWMYNSITTSYIFILAYICLHRLRLKYNKEPLKNQHHGISKNNELGTRRTRVEIATFLYRIGSCGASVLSLSLLL